MNVAVKGIYKKGKITLLEELKGVKEAEVMVVVTKEKKERKKKKEDITTKIVEALREVKLMREGRIPEIDARKILNEI